MHNFQGSHLIIIASLALSALPAFAQSGDAGSGTTSTKSSSFSSSSSSASQTVETGSEQRIGVKNANKVLYKYKERLNTYVGQIEMGLNKGWLTQEEGDKFKKELARLNELESSVSSKGYQKAEVDDLEKQVTTFNIEFTKAANKPAQTSKSAAASSAGAAKTPTEKAKTQTPAPSKTQTKPAPAKAASASKSGSAAKQAPKKASPAKK